MSHYCEYDYLSDNEFLVASAIVHAVSEADGDEWGGIWLTRHGIVRTGKSYEGIIEVHVDGTTVSFHPVHARYDVIAERNVCDPEATHELVKLLRGFMCKRVCKRCCSAPCNLDHSRLCWQCRTSSDKDVVALMMFGGFLVILGMSWSILQVVLGMN
jgi:hypothetical protein